LVDVGGQRSERRKWFHCFDIVTAIMFCVAISEYNLMLAEDARVNRMHESLKLFQEICNCDFFKDVAIILFLNKIDLFKDKIGDHSMSGCFPDYTGKQNYDEASVFIRDKFIALNNVDKTIYSHFTCATNTKNIRFVVEVVKNMILQTALNDKLDIDYLVDLDLPPVHIPGRTSKAKSSPPKEAPAAKKAEPAKLKKEPSKKELPKKELAAKKEEPAKKKPDNRSPTAGSSSSEEVAGYDLFPKQDLTKRNSTSMKTPVPTNWAIKFEDIQFVEVIGNFFSFFSQTKRNENKEQITNDDDDYKLEREHRQQQK